MQRSVAHSAIRTSSRGLSAQSSFKSDGRESVEHGVSEPLLGARAPTPTSPGDVATSMLPLGTKNKYSLKSDLRAVWDIVGGSWLNWLLLCAPLGFASEMLGWGATITFSLNFFALVPLALILGDVTEDMALRCGVVIGGLLNATFGNVVEIILSIAALQKGLYTVVSTSLLGSILSNLLLVLGCCFLFGGINHKIQTFNALANKACNSMLFMSVIGIVIPTAAVQLSGNGSQDSDETWVLEISRGTAIVLLSMYVCYLVFQLKTHHDMFTSDDEENGEQPALSVPAAVSMLTVITLVVACCSEFLTGSLEEVADTLNVSQGFLGMIVLPIAGNACEHITAVVVAAKNKMDLALGVAIGSSIQIAIFAIPLVVLVGWATGHPFSLSFDPFVTVAMTVSVIHANFVTNDATSHWLMGVQLIATYLLIAITFLYKTG